MNKKANILTLFILPFTLAFNVFAGEMIYFKSYDGEKFACDQANLTYNLDHENGKLAAICSLLALPEVAEVAEVEDGKSEETAIRLDVDGKLFRKYILNIFRYGKVAFKNKADAENTLTLCEDLGLPLAEEYICRKVLKIKTRKARTGPVGMNLARGLGSSVDNSEMDEILGSFAELQGGTFQMGSPADERNRQVNEAQHVVTLSDFELGEAAITQETYAKIMGTNPSVFKEQRHCPHSFKDVEGPGGQHIAVCADHPVELVSWNNAIQFIDTVNARFKDLGYRYSLPTEAQLEYAFRGGTETAYVSGADEGGMEEYAWNTTYSNNQTHPVKSKRANEFGIYQSSVREWANDLFEFFPASGTIDPRGPAGGLAHVIRGCAWYQNASDHRSACRNCNGPDSSAFFLGFRLLRIQET